MVQVKNALLGNKNQQKCPFCGCDMKTAMHSDLNFGSPDAIQLMCLSILHFLLHILGHVLKVGYHNTVKKWNPPRYTPEEKIEMHYICKPKTEKVCNTGMFLIIFDSKFQKDRSLKMSFTKCYIILR